MENCFVCKDAVLPYKKGNLIGKQGLQCKKCKNYFHWSCDKVTEEEFKQFRNLNHEMFPWFCLQCRPDLESMSCLAETVNCLMIEVKSLRLEIVELKSELANQQKPKIDDLEKIQIINEIEERRKKEQNIIIFNLNESESREIEKQKIAELLEAIDPSLVNQMNDCFRIGKPVSSKPRPVKLLFNKIVNINSVFKNLYKLKVSKFKSVSIKRDQTIMQRDLNKKYSLHLKSSNSKINYVKWFNDIYLKELNECKSN